MARYFNDDGNLREVGELARDIHLDGYHCSETFVRAVWPHLFPEKDLSKEILRMTMVMHGGIADCMSSHCGGLTIGILMIGLLYGREDIAGDERLAPSIARRFWQRFLDEFGTSHCTTLRSSTPLTGEAPTRCGCIIVKSVRLLMNFVDEIKINPINVEEIYTWKVDRTKEPCHESIVPIKSSTELKAEALLRNTKM